MKSLRLGAALLAGGLAAAAGAQVQYPVGAVVQPLNNSAGEALADHLRTLSDQPNSVHALIGAGNSALKLGDPQTALTFFARAEEASPRDARAKAGMGSAFVQMEQPQVALKFFADAVSLGMPAQLVAADRGLAYDMTGDPVRAQADYALALQGGSDAEVERRMALSRAISGDKAGAIAILDRQLRQQDRAAWRARAFVLALSGDTAEAAKAVEAVMPTQQARALRPFLEHLPNLGLAERAMAVHFGHFPGQYARAVAPAGRPGRGEPALGGISPVQTIGGSRSRPAAAKSEPQAPATRTITRTYERVGSRFPIRETVVVPVEPKPKSDAPLTAGQARPAQPLATQPTIAAPPPAPLPSPQPAAARIEQAPPSAKAAERPVQLAAASKFDFAAVAAAVQSLEDADAPAQAAVKAAAKEAKPPAAKAPGRIWVQLAASQNKAAFAGEYKKLSARAPTLLKGKAAWTAPFRSTNRLLVGPFETVKDAGDLVDELAKLEIDSFSWSSAEGQEIEKIDAR